MKIEILYPEFGCLYGDYGNIIYLQSSLPGAEFIFTHSSQHPRFLTEKVDLIYQGGMTEHNQLFAIEKMRTYMDGFRAFVEDYGAVLFTGNAIELLGEYIDTGSEKIPCLGMFPFHAERDMSNRKNFLLLAEYEGIKIVGNKSQFSEIHGDTGCPFMKVLRGTGDHSGAEYEGVHYKNLFATYLLGPLLPQNPLFMKKLMELMGAKGEPAFLDQAIEAYRARLAQLENPNQDFVLHEH